MTYQWRKALRLNMAVNCSETRLKSSWMAVELPTKVADIFRPRGGMSQTAVWERNEERRQRRKAGGKGGKEWGKEGVKEGRNGARKDGWNEARKGGSKE